MRAEIIGLAICVGLFLLPARAGAITGNQLFETCGTAEQTSQAWSSGFCDGYIAGVFESLAPVGGIICPSPEVTNQQVVDVVRQFLKAAPEVRDKAGSVLVSYALRRVFPCQTRDRGE